MCFFSISDRDTSICNTVGCVNAAADVLKFMDPSVDPCSDFYDFSCGRFLNETVLSDEKVSVDTFSIVRDQTQNKLLRLIDAPTVDNDLKSFRLAKDLYQSCMNRSQIENLGLQTVKEMHESLGGWPCVEGETWNENDTWNWVDANKMLIDHGFGHSYLFVISIDTDMRDSTRRRIVVKYQI